MASEDEATKTLREYARKARAGQMPPDNVAAWMKSQAEKRGLDYPTLIGAGSGAFVGGAKAGASFGFGDELKGVGAALMPGGADYKGARDQSRKVMKTQEFLSPAAFIAGQVAGGVASSAVPVAGWVGRGAQAGRLAAATRGVAAGAAEGALTGYGEQEGNNSPLTKDVAISTGLGAAGGLAGDVLARMGRRSPRARQAAKDELQRIMDEYGLDPDAAIQAIATDKLPIAVQNRTLLMEARAAYNNASGDVRREVYESTGRNAQTGRANVADTAAQALPPNLRATTDAGQFPRSVEAKDAAARYKQAYQTGNASIARNGVDPKLMAQVEKMAVMDPRVIDLINKNAMGIMAEQGMDITKFKPVVKRGPKGEIVWTEAPSLESLAATNRSASNVVSSMFKNAADPQPTQLRDALNTTQQTFRDDLGKAFPAWGDVTADVARQKTMEDAYKLGSRAMTSPDEAARLLAELPNLDPNALTAVRAAAVEAIRKKMAGAGPTASPIRGLMQSEGGIDSHVVTLVRELFPGDQLQRAMTQGQGAQDLANVFRAPSQTAELLARGQRYAGNGGGLTELATTLGADAATGSHMAITGARYGGKAVEALAKKFGVGPDAADKVLQALTTTDPELARRLIEGDPAAVEKVGNLFHSMVLSTGATAATQTKPGIMDMLGGDDDGR